MFSSRWNSHSAAPADFSGPQIFGVRARGHVLPGPQNTTEPEREETAVEKQTAEIFFTGYLTHCFSGSNSRL